MSAHNPRPVSTLSDAPDFLRASAKRLGWGNLAGQIVMDIGCGSGNSSSTLLELFPQILRVIAVDFSERKLQEARRVRPHESIEYRLADIENRLSLEEWSGKMSKIVSVHCFNCLRDVETGFQNLHHLLRPGGEAALLLMLRSPYLDLIEEVSRHEIFRRYLVDLTVIFPQPHSKKQTADHYHLLLKSLGFEVLKCSEEPRVHFYDSEEQCKNLLYLACPLKASLSGSTKQEFMDFMFNRFKTSNQRDGSGRLTMQNIVLEILVRKPYQIS